MSVSIASVSGDGSGNEWLGRLCLRYVNRSQGDYDEELAELCVLLPLPQARDNAAMELEIQNIAHAGGISTLLQLYNTSCAETVGYRRAGWVEALALQNASHFDPSLIYIASYHGRPVGFCMARKSRQMGRITGIAVRPEFRRRGFATALLRHALDVLAQRGATEAFLHADVGDPASLGLFLHLGFTPRS